MDLKNIKLGIIGMGYVGLPLAIEFAKKIKVIGYDINSSRINNLKKNYDETREVLKKQIKNAKNLSFTSEMADIKDCNIYIVTVPTPIKKNKLPELKPLISASRIIGGILKKGNIVIYESTVYPGATEEVCIPILEKNSKLHLNKDFYVGYSPERINPGDKKKKLQNITKITSGSNLYSSRIIDKLYSQIVKAGIHRAKSIKIAEAAKVIENTQRDLNIALINELSILFKKLKISSEEVFKAAETKWNFISFRPGLVGGHCIGVDPYYLTYKSKKIGYKPKIILAGRKLNDSMSNYISSEIITKFNERKINVRNSKILIMGMTFKENCSDIRNSKVLDLEKILKKKGANIFFYDPLIVKSPELKKKYKIIDKPKLNFYDCILIAVKHKNFIKIKNNIKTFNNRKGFIYDIKYLLNEKKNYFRI